MEDREQDMLDGFEAWAFNTPDTRKLEPEHIIKYLDSDTASPEFLEEIRAMTGQAIGVITDTLLDEGNHVPPVHLKDFEKIIRLCDAKLAD